MTKEELAIRLNGRPRRNEIAKDEEHQAKAERLLVVFGASDDLCELRGVINDEVGAYEGCTLLISKTGLLMPAIDRDDIDVLEKHNVLKYVLDQHDGAVKINVSWCSSPEYSWTVETDTPHATFDIYEDSHKFCRGIVLDLKELADFAAGKEKVEFRREGIAR